MSESDNPQPLGAIPDAPLPPDVPGREVAGLDEPTDPIPTAPQEVEPPPRAGDPHVPTQPIAHPGEYPPPQAILRPSTLARMIEAHAASRGLAAKDIDPYRFRQERGLPSPKRRYRVTPRKGKEAAAPIECDAVDEAEAVAYAVRAHRIGQSHQWTWNVFVLDQ